MSLYPHPHGLSSHAAKPFDVLLSLKQSVLCMLTTYDRKQGQIVAISYWRTHLPYRPKLMYLLTVNGMNQLDLPETIFHNICARHPFPKDSFGVDYKPTSYNL